MNATTITGHINAAVAAVLDHDLDRATRHIHTVCADGRPTAYTAVLSCAETIAGHLAPQIAALVPAGHRIHHVALARPDEIPDPTVADTDDTFTALVATAVNRDTTGALRLLDMLDDPAIDRLAAHAVVVVARWADT